MPLVIADQEAAAAWNHRAHLPSASSAAWIRHARDTTGAENRWCDGDGRAAGGRKPENEEAAGGARPPIAGGDAGAGAPRRLRAQAASRSSPSDGPPAAGSVVNFAAWKVRTRSTTTGGSSHAWTGAEAPAGHRQATPSPTSHVGRVGQAAQARAVPALALAVGRPAMVPSADGAGGVLGIPVFMSLSRGSPPQPSSGGSIPAAACEGRVPRGPAPGGSFFLWGPSLAMWQNRGVADGDGWPRAYSSGLICRQKRIGQFNGRPQSRVP